MTTSHRRFLPLSPTSYMAHSRKRQKPFPNALVHIQSNPISCPNDGDHFIRTITRIHIKIPEQHEHFESYQKTFIE